jgi:hypothetical protein
MHQEEFLPEIDHFPGYPLSAADQWRNSRTGLTIPVAACAK